MTLKPRSPALTTIAQQIGNSTLMCSGIDESGDDCDYPATHKVWIGKEEDSWVGICNTCTVRAEERKQRVAKL